jgi:hypothetical protein
MYGLIVYARGYVPVQSRWLSLDEGEVTLDFYLETGPGPTGYILDAQGRPVEGAEIYLINCGRKLTVSNGHVHFKTHENYTKSDDSGWFDFGPQYAPQAFVVLSDYGFGWATAQDLSTSSTITLAPWSRVTGQSDLKTQSSSPRRVTLARLTQDGLDQYIRLAYYYETDDEGLFDFKRLVHGSYRRSGDHERFDVQPGQALRMYWQYSLSSVAGRVVDPRGTTLDQWDTHLALVMIDPDADNFKIPAEQLKQWVVELPNTNDPNAVHVHTPYLDRSGGFRIEDLDAGRYVLCGCIDQHSFAKAEAVSLGTIWHEFELPADIADIAGTADFVHLGDIYLTQPSPR